MDPGPAETAARPLAVLASGIGFVAAALALPVVLMADGPLSGWLLGVSLWTVNWLAALATGRLAVNMTATAAVGVSGVSFIARAWLVAIVLFVVALRYSEPAGLTAAGVFLAAFTFDLLGRTALYATRQRAPRGALPR